MEEILCFNCESPIKSDEMKWHCSCGLTIWKNISGTVICDDQLKKLMEKGSTDVLSFISRKSGKPFMARVVMNGNKTEFRFEETEQDVSQIIRVKKMEGLGMSKLKNINEKVNKVILCVGVFLFTQFICASNVFAADWASSKVATGTKSLITDIGKWLLIIAPIAGTLVCVYFFIRRGAADEMDQKKWNDRIKTAIISTIGAVVISGLIVLLASYYGATVTTGM